MTFSVVVPSYNSSATISQCLSSLLAQSHAAQDIIVVDSSDDETPSIIDSEFPQVEPIYLSEKTLPGRARNIGVRQARGQIIAFTDADCVAEPDWLAALGRAYKAHPEVAGVGGVVGIANPEQLPGTIGYLLEFSEFAVGSRAEKKAMMPTCNVSFRREVFARFGGFVEDRFWAEDVIFTRRLTGAGEILRLCPQAIVRHRNRETWPQVYEHQFSAGGGFAAARRFEPDLPGAFLLKHGFIARFIPAVRWWRIARRLWVRDRKLLCQFLMASPHVARGLFEWHRGFREAVANFREDSAVRTNA